VKITDGSSCGFPLPTRLYSAEGATPKPLRKRA
jgi:hypothetical protein